MAPVNYGGAVIPPPQPTLPRELLRWTQSLDLSYAVKNVKRDFCNGFLIAEIFSRYYPQDVEMHTFDNGSRNMTRNDNWEQLYKILNRRGLSVTRMDIDPVVKQVPGAAIMILTKLYQFLTKRAVPKVVPADQLGSPLDPARTAAEQPAAETGNANRRPSKDNLPAQDAFSLGGQQQAAPAAVDTQDIYSIFQSSRRTRPSGRGQNKTVQAQEMVAPLVIREPVVKKVERNVAQLRAQRDAQQQQLQQQSSQQQQRSRTTTSMSGRKSVGGYDGSGAQPSTPSPGHAGAVKPVIDLMRPLVNALVQESDSVMRSLDPRKDVVVSFMELCKGDVVPEEMTVRVFESLSNRAALLVDTLVKSPTEFYRMWSLLSPALADFAESSPVFESVVVLFKRIGEQMREADPVLTQQLLIDVGLPSLSPLLSEAAGKREALCDLIYSFSQENLTNHLAVLKQLKETIEKLPIYISCLSSMVALEAQVGLLDQGLLDLYTYYSLVGLQSPQPKIRVSGLSIFSAIAIAPGTAYRIVVTNGLSTMQGLVNDDWWEVKAQLVILAARLLRRCTASAEEDQGEDPSVPPPTEDQVEALLGIVAQCFRPNLSKNVLQVGLSELAPCLSSYRSLIPNFVNILLAHPHPLRRRLLGLDENRAEVGARRLAYVMGTSSRLYEEAPITMTWPAVAVARCFAEHVSETSLNHFETEHMEVLTSCLPEGDFEPGTEETQEWLWVYEKLKDYIFVALVDPELHIPACGLIRRFWLSADEAVVSHCVEISRKTLLQTLRILYSHTVDRTKVEEEAFLDFVAELKGAGGLAEKALVETVEGFRESNQAEYSASSLDRIFS